MRTLVPIAVLLAMSLAAPVMAQEPIAAPAMAPAAPDSWESIAGQVILHYVEGRSLEDAGGPSFNPYGIEVDPLLFALGAFFITADYAGEGVHEGEVAIFPQFTTPRSGAFEASPSTPAIIPFAMLKAGTCYGGYVTGHPVPDQVIAVDMTGLQCHAALVDEAVYALYQAASEEETAEPMESVPAPDTGFDPRNPLDADLDRAAWVAYRAAYTLATSNAEYDFAPAGDYAPLREIVAAALVAEGLGAVEVSATPGASVDDVMGCAATGGVELHIALTADNAGIAIVAVSPRRMSSYVYDPDTSDELLVQPARTCRTSGAGRADTANEP